MPFQLPQLTQQASGEKRAGDTSTQPAPKKQKGLPDLSDLVAMEAAPKRQSARRLPAVAPLNVCIYQVSDRASDIWSQFDGIPGAKLWQMQMDIRNTVTYLFLTDLSRSRPCEWPR